MNSSVFSTQHPIVCLPMNGVSDLKLAIAVAESGCLPSFFVFNNVKDRGLQGLVQDLKLFQNIFGHCNLLLSISQNLFVKNYKNIIEIILKYKVTYVELLKITDDLARKSVVALRKRGVKVGFRACSLNKHQEPFYHHLDFIIVKGNESAGYIGDGDQCLSEILQDMRKKYPNLLLIASGGISDRNDIAKIEPYCDAVGIGTLFAMSKESCISSKTKQLALNKSIQPIKGFDGLQNAIVFSTVEHDDNNNNLSLNQGINGTGGHIFAGQALQKIDRIMSVKEIVDKLAER